MSSIRRALQLLPRIRRPTQLAASAAAAAAGRRHLASTPSPPPGLNYYYSHSGYTWRKQKWGLIVGIFLSGQTGIILGSIGNPIFAEDASGSELVTENDQGQASITGLRRIEDGSVISNEHTSKWRIYTDNARDLSEKGKLDEAEKFFQAALWEAKEGFGPRDPHVASSCNNLAELYRVQKAFDKAEPLYKEAISILENSLGPDDVRVGAALHNLGQFYLAQRKLQQAQNCYERALKIKGRVLGYGHPDYSETMHHLGTVLHLQGKEKEAKDLIQESIRILEEVGLGESAMCIRRLRYLSQILLNSNQLNEAENLQRKILHVLELSKGWDSLETVISAEGLALTLQTLGKLTEAQELLERCLDAKKKILPQDHVQISSNYLHLARMAMLKANNLRRAKVSEIKYELDMAKSLLENSIRIAKANLASHIKNQNISRGSKAHSQNQKDQHAALIILVHSLDAFSLLEAKKLELRESGNVSELPCDVELVLRECIVVFKEPYTRTMLLDASDIKSQYLSCVKHLLSLVNSDRGKSPESNSLADLLIEAKHIESELTSKKH